MSCLFFKLGYKIIRRDFRIKTNKFHIIIKTGNCESNFLQLPKILKGLIFLKHFILFSIGGFAYIIIEMLWRGCSHWSMFFLGGICFVFLGKINEFFPWDMPLFIQMIIGAFMITVLEFAAGYILNIHLDLNVWDYSDMPFNIMGQICIPYTALWFILSGACVMFDDFLRYYLFNEEKPHYRLV